tara:strand:+ start:107 stop:529 length:423 start_codon:yes stop_codon:yes gene_type:complete
MKLRSVVVVLLVALIGGVGFFVLTRNTEEYATQDENNIQLGSVEHNYTQLEELQKAVDEGHQPWRLDPIEVAKTESLEYGFRQQDRFALVSQELGTAPAATYFAYIEVEHRGKLYTMQLYQPQTIGDGGIWTLNWIAEKE